MVKKYQRVYIGIPTSGVLVTAGFGMSFKTTRPNNWMRMREKSTRRDEVRVETLQDSQSDKCKSVDI